MGACDYRNPLKLSGTAQENRYPEFLNPDLIKIDGKTTDDYRRIAQEFAEIIQYYNGSNQRDGSWDFFFADANYVNANPHVALFKTFIKLLGYAQDDLNKLTGKHLEFYYQDVLKMARRAENPDSAHILFKLANNVEAHVLKKGTLLRGGKDANGDDLLFETETEIVVNKAEVNGLKSISVQKNEADISLVYASPIANSADGLGADLDEENPKWTAFGDLQTATNALEMPLADLGFAIASDFLLLREGSRIVHMTLTFSEAHGIPTDAFESADFNIWLSGEKEWISCSILDLVEDEAQGITVDDTTLKISFKLTESDPAVFPYNDEVLAGGFETNSPLLKLNINQSSTKEVYKHFVEKTIATIDFSVDVKGVQDLVLRSESGALDPAKPFEPFSYEPSLGSDFLIGSQEIFSKALTEIKLKFDWQNLPSSFGTYYNHYGFSPSVDKDDFKVKAHYLKDRKWEAFKNGTSNVFTLFQTGDEILLSNPKGLETLTEVAEIADFDSTTQNGFIKLEISGPNLATGIKAFGHAQFKNAYVLAAINISRGDADTLPQEPYTPKTKSFSINYKAAHQINLSAARTEDNPNGHLFHIGAFGPYLKKEAELTILPKYDFAGAFYIGLDNLELPQNLNLLFQVAEGSENPDVLPPTVNWQYLQTNQWTDFESEAILADGTNGMINSGIVSFDLPKEMTNDNSRLPADTFWIRAFVESEADGVCDMINVHPQAITASFLNQENDLGHLVNPLSAGTINKLNESDSTIKEVVQPYASFGGRLPEEEDNYYQRAAERLRHKNRAITIWDYERLVLEAFPSVYKVKCLNHTRMAVPYSEQAPGHVSLVIVSNLSNQNAIDPLKPTTSLSTLNAIDAFLEPIRNPFIQLHVKNPQFEEVKAKFNVRFHIGVDKGTYEKKIKEDIKAFLSPWAFSEGEDIVFEGVIHKSRIIDFVEELDYVDFVTCFQLFHILPGGDPEGEEKDEITTTKSGAILVSHKTHEVTVLTTEDCECDENKNVQKTS